MTVVAQTLPGQLQVLHYQPVVDAAGQPVLLGRGSYASVYRYTDTRTGEAVAIKRIALRGVLPSSKGLLSDWLKRELLNHHMLNHPHVLKLKDVFVADHHLNLVLELADQGMLFKRVQAYTEQQQGHMPEPEARWFFQQLVLTMDYFHTKGVAHRDIKLENTLLKSRPGHRWPAIKVSDFGFSKYNANNTYTTVGTYAYMSPEVVKAQELKLPYDAVRADIWSAGVLLYTMLVGQYPFNPDMPKLLLLQQMTKRPLKLPAHLGQGVRQLLEGLLHPDPSQRYTTRQITQDPWFLQGLPAGALSMNEAHLRQPSPCVKSREEVLEAVNQAMEIMG